MPIILPEPTDVDGRSRAIIDVAMSIALAVRGDAPVDIYDLAEEIVDRILPPAHNGPPLAAIREWQERHRAEQLAEDNARLDAIFSASRPKPRIRVRAATQPTA